MHTQPTTLILQTMDDECISVYVDCCGVEPSKVATYLNYASDAVITALTLHYDQKHTQHGVNEDQEPHDRDGLSGAMGDVGCKSAHGSCATTSLPSSPGITSRILKNPASDIGEQSEGYRHTIPDGDSCSGSAGSVSGSSSAPTSLKKSTIDLATSTAPTTAPEQPTAAAATGGKTRRRYSNIKRPKIWISCPDGEAAKESEEPQPLFLDFEDIER